MVGPFVPVGTVLLGLISAFAGLMIWLRWTEKAMHEGSSSAPGLKRTLKAFCGTWLCFTIFTVLLIGSAIPDGRVIFAETVWFLVLLGPAAGGSFYVTMVFFTSPLAQAS